MLTVPGEIAALVLAVLLGLYLGWLVWGRGTADSASRRGPRHAASRRSVLPTTYGADLATGDVRVLPRAGRDGKRREPAHATRRAEAPPDSPGAAESTNENAAVAEESAGPAIELAAGGRAGEPPEADAAGPAGGPGVAGGVPEPAEVGVKAGRGAEAERGDESAGTAVVAVGRPGAVAGEAGGRAEADAGSGVGAEEERVEAGDGSGRTAQPALHRAGFAAGAGRAAAEVGLASGGPAWGVRADAAVDGRAPVAVQGRTADGNPDATSPAGERRVDLIRVNGVAPAREQVDDLRQVVGIGPVIQRVLAGAGITTYRQLAGLAGDQDALARTGAALGGDVRGRIERQRWVEQARELHFRKYGERLEQ
jgi:predicted flap endonuclease-1-like 5' DNA nuclease